MAAGVDSLVTFHMVGVVDHEGCVQPFDRLSGFQAGDEELSSCSHSWEALAVQLSGALSGVAVTRALSAQEAVVVADCADCPWHWVGFTNFLSSEEASVTLLAGSLTTDIAGRMGEFLGCRSAVGPSECDCCS